MLNCEVSLGWRNHYEALYYGILKQKGERWRSYATGDKIYPTDAELANLKGLVISGAEHAAYDKDSTTQEFEQFVFNMNRNHPHLKVLGVCYGCQVLAHSLGGKAAKMINLDKPFIGRLENVKVTPSLKEKSYYRKTLEQLNLSESNEFVAVESHGDHVSELPENGVILANSASTSVEMWGLEDRILSVQFHPEFNGPLMKKKVIENADLDDDKKQTMLKGFEESEQVYKLDRTFQVRLCRNFLKST